jgi:hypothetical protein
VPHSRACASIKRRCSSVARSERPFQVPLCLLLCAALTQLPAAAQHRASPHYRSQSRHRAGALPRLAIATPPLLGHSIVSHSIASSPVSYTTGHLTLLVISSRRSPEFGATVSPVRVARCHLPPAASATDEQPPDRWSTHRRGRRMS